MVLRVKPTPTQFPTNSLYTPMDNTPLHSISSDCHPWCRLWRWDPEMIEVVHVTPNNWAGKIVKSQLFSGLQRDISSLFRYLFVLTNLRAATTLARICIIGLYLLEIIHVKPIRIGVSIKTSNGDSVTKRSIANWKSLSLFPQNETLWRTSQI